MANYNVSNSIGTVVSGLTGANTVSLTSVSYSTVEGGAGNDTIKGNSGSNFNRYEGGAGNDVFYVYNDSLKGAPNTINGGVGNTINGGAGNDTIYVGPVSAATGDQKTRSYGTVIEYSNDDGNDVIYDSRDVIAKGNRSSEGYAEYTVKLTAGKVASTMDNGTDILITVTSSAASATDATSLLTLKNASGANLSFLNEDELFVSRGHDYSTAKATLSSGEYDNNRYSIAAAKDEDGVPAIITNRGEKVAIAAAGKAGTFSHVANYGANVSITASAASTIDNRGASAVIKGSGAADHIYNYNDGNNINGNAGNDEIVNYQGHKSSLLGGAGDDKISVVSGQAVTVSGDAGNDTIYNSGDRTVIIGGAGNDIVSLDGGSAVVQYASNMGKDVIYGFGANDTLHLSKGNITDAAIDGSDVVLTVANAKNTITLKNAAQAMSAGGTINLKVGTFESVAVTSDTLTTEASKATPGWTVENGVATYGTAAKPLTQITGLSNKVTTENVDSYLSLAGKNVTIKNDEALAEGTASISGGYNLVLGAGVTKSTTKSAASWKVVDGTAFYTTANITSGYTLASNRKSITYNEGSTRGKTVTVMISGLAKTTKAATLKTAMNESTGVITLPKAALPAANTSVYVEMTNMYPEELPYTLALAKGVAQSTTTDAGWSIAGTTASYKTGGTTGAYEISDTENGQKVTYNTTKTKPVTMVTLTGLKKGTKASSIFVNNGVITLTKDIIGTTNMALTTSPGYEWTLALDRGKNDLEIPEPTFEKLGYWKTKEVNTKVKDSDGNTETYSSNTATFYTPKVTKTGYGYTISDDNKNVTYYANNSGNKASLVLSGLASGLETGEATADSQGTITGVDFDTKNNIITISNGAINENNDALGGIKISGTVNAGAKFIIDSESAVKLTNSTKVAVAIQGGSGNTFLIGGAGIDTLYSGEGSAKTLQGGAGNDIVYGQNTSDNAVTTTEEAVYDKKGNETGTITIASVILDGGAGNDEIYSGAGGASLAGGAGNDSLYGGAGADTLDGGAGNDMISVGSGVALADGGAGNDEIYGGTGTQQTLLGNAGNDTIYGKNTEIVRDENDDTAPYVDDNGNPTVVLDGGAGNDVMYAGTGGGLMLGDAGNDKLYGDAGSDTLYGGAGADTLDGGAGDDVLYGYQFYSVEVSDYDDTKAYNAATLAASKDGADVINAGAGNDIVYGGYGNDKLYGEAGNDVIYGGMGNDTIEGGDGNDKLYGYEEYDENDDAAVALAKKDGADVLKAGAGEDTLFGGAGADKLYGGEDSSTLYGGDGNDTLYAESANGELYGDAGADHLYGGTGKAILHGGDGADTFYYATEEYGENVIADFEVTSSENTKTGATVWKAVDKIKLTDMAFTKANFETLVAKNGKVEGDDVVINFGSGHILTIEGAADKQLTFVNSTGKVTMTKIFSADDSSGLMAEDNFITADNLSQIVETSSVGDFELNTDPGKLQAENLITYAEK